MVNLLRDHQNRAGGNPRADVCRVQVCDRLLLPAAADVHPEECRPIPQFDRVRLEKADRARIVVLHFDPGFAVFGIVVVTGGDGQFDFKFHSGGRRGDGDFPHQ